MTAQDFLNMTRYEFVLKQKERVKAERQRVNEQRAQAWYIAMLQRQPKLPELTEILISDEPAKPAEMTDEQMLNKAKMLNAMYGGDFIEV